MTSLAGGAQLTETFYCIPGHTLNSGNIIGESARCGRPGVNLKRCVSLLLHRLAHPEMGERAHQQRNSGLRLSGWCFGETNTEEYACSWQLMES